MAKNKVQIDVKVDDKGTTKKVGLDSKKAAEGLDNTAKSARTADRNLKGTAQASSNATKNFSKMAQGTGGLVAAYATLAANIFAISAAFQFLKRAGDLRALEKAQQQYTSKTGLSMKLLTSRVQEATGGIVSFQEASQAAAIGIAAGLSPDQLERLGAAAKNAAAALGRDTTDAFQRLTRGAIKAEPELLDELGLIIRLEKATKDYAKAMNIVDRELTTFEKTQAVVNATLTQAEEKFDDIGGNVNDVARLGKAFDDLVKGIQRAIVGPAEFIADVFTKNIFALSAAFALLGVNITKAMAPTVDFKNISDLAGAAKQRISGAALTGSKTGAALAGGDFSAQHLNRLKVAAGAKTSTVINLSKMEEKQIRRDIKLIEAEHARAMATMKGGFKGYVMGAIANLKLLQAQHGMVMGTMKAGVMGFASFASKAMNAIAIVGMLTLAISMAKELLNLLKSKELRAMEERAEKMRNRFKEQNEALRETLDTLDLAETKMGRIVQHANAFSQISTRGSTRLLDGIINLQKDQMFRTLGGNPLRKAKTETVDTGERKVATSQRRLIAGEQGTVTEFLRSMELASEAAKGAGKDTSDFDGKLVRLSGTMQMLNSANLETKEGVDQYNIALNNMRYLIPQITDDKNNLGVALNAEKNAIGSINKAYETYLQLQTRAKGSLSLAGQASANISEFAAGLAGQTSISNTDTLEGLTPKNLQSIANVLGMEKDAVKGMTKQSVMDLLNSKGTGITATQKKLDQGPALARRDLLDKQRTGFEFIKKEAQFKKQIADIDHKLLGFVQERQIAEALGTQLTTERKNQIDAETQALKKQQDLIRYNMSEIGQLSNTLQSSLESGLTNAINGLIQGTMDMKEAFSSMAKSVLASMAQILAQQAATSLLGSMGFSSNRYGGIVSNGKNVQGYSMGGIARGKDSGYLAELHGTEAVVPLPNGRSIPVDLSGQAGQVNNVTVNIASDGQTQTRADGDMDSEKLGKAVASAVQKELQNQKRSGGILSPYGAA